MLLEVIQSSKQAYGADFSIYRDGAQVGSVHFAGHMASMECDVEGEFCGIIFSMRFGFRARIGRSNTFRLYKLFVNEKEAGEIYQTVYKEAGFLHRFDYHQLVLDGRKYDLFPIAFGKEGLKCPVYCADQQLALIEKECVVRDDLHHFRIAAVNDSASFTGLLFSCYMYLHGYYKPGQVVSKSYSKEISRTRNEYLKAKYDPDFLTSHFQ